MSDLIKFKEDGFAADFCEITGGLAGAVLGAVAGIGPAAMELIERRGDLKAAGKAWGETIGDVAEDGASLSKKHGPAVLTFVTGAALTALIGMAVKSNVSKLE